MLNLALTPLTTLKVSVFSLLMIVMMCSCQEAYDPDFEHTKRMVVNSDIAPDRDVHLSITASASFGEDPSPVRDASVELAFEQELVSLEYDGDLFEDRNLPLYKAEDLSINPEATVILSAKHHSLPDIIATTTIPTADCPENIRTTILSERVEAGIQSTVVSIDLQLDEGVLADDFYGYHVLASYRLAQIRTVNGSVISEPESFLRDLDPNSYLDEAGLLKDYSEGILISPENLTASRSVQILLEIDHHESDEELSSVQVELRTLSQEYSSYHLQLSTLIRRARSENIYQEPVVDYTNITDGHGYFGGYNYCTTEVSELIR